MKEECQTRLSVVDVYVNQLIEKDAMSNHNIRLVVDVFDEIFGEIGYVCVDGISKVGEGMLYGIDERLGYVSLVLRFYEAVLEYS